MLKKFMLNIKNIQQYIYIVLNKCNMKADHAILIIYFIQFNKTQYYSLVQEPS